MNLLPLPLEFLHQIIALPATGNRPNPHALLFLPASYL